MSQEKTTEQKPSVKEEKTSKTCTKCGETKLLTEFYRGGKCKECLKVAQRERNKKNKEKAAEIKNDPDMKKQTKICSKCKETKQLTEFRVGRGECLDCERAFGRKYNQDHQDIRKKWQEENKEHFDDLRAKRYQRKKEEIRDKYNTRYNEDPCFHIHKLLQRRISASISKIKSTKKYVGTKYENIAKWLEFNFTDEMTWENHGTYWDIDHVIPICKWDLNNQEEIDICFNWKNLSPFECSKNRHEKRDKIDKKQIERHIAQLESYFAENELNDNLEEYMKKYNAKLQ